MAEPAPLLEIEPRATRSLAERAYEMLVEKITRLEIPPRALLAEKSLMVQLGIGRTPIREALQRLAIEGLVDHQPNRGMFVTEISAAGVQEIYEFRGIIDGYAARLAAIRANERDNHDLKAAAAALAEAARRNDVNAYVAHDRRFYYVLARAAQNVYLAEAIPRIFNLHLRLWFFISERRGGWQDVALAHEQMIRTVTAAVARRDPDEANLAVSVYISRRHQDIRDLL